MRGFSLSWRRRADTTPIGFDVGEIPGLPDSLRIGISGYVDGTNRGRLAEQLRSCLSNQPTAVLIDLRDMGHAGDSGLSVFMEALKSVRENGGRLVFCGVRSGVYATWSTLGVASLFQIYKSQSEAVSYLKASRHNE